jgi:hypothetical protein
MKKFKKIKPFRKSEDIFLNGKNLEAERLIPTSHAKIQFESLDQSPPEGQSPPEVPKKRVA